MSSAEPKPWQALPGAALSSCRGGRLLTNPFGVSAATDTTIAADQGFTQSAPSLISACYDRCGCLEHEISNSLTTVANDELGAHDVFRSALRTYLASAAVAFFEAHLPFQGRITVIFVPFFRELAMVNLPPICSARSRIPVRPMPSCRSRSLKPSPSSENSNRTSFALQTRCVSKFRA